MLAERVTHAADDQQRQALDRAEDLGRRLIFDPDDNSYRHKREPWEQERFTRRAADHPAVLKRALESFAEGVDWLLAHWRELEHTLTTFGTWEIPEAHLAARLLGRRPEDSTEDAVVTVLLLNMLRAMYEPGDYLPTYDAFARIRLFDSSRPVSAARVTLLEAAPPPTPEEAPRNSSRSSTPKQRGCARGKPTPSTPAPRPTARPPFTAPISTTRPPPCCSAVMNPLANASCAAPPLNWPSWITARARWSRPSSSTRTPRPHPT